MKVNKECKAYKTYKKCFDMALSAKSLRAGLFAVCFLMAACMAAGCGKKGELFSELRGEDVSAAEEAQEGGDSGKDGFTAGKDPETVDGGAPSEKPEAGVDSGASQNSGTGEIGTAQDADIEAGKIYVHVCGAVNDPGVYELPSGSRFYEAVEAAGGYAEGACEDYLNMAAPLADGSRLEIPTREEIREREETAKAESASGRKSDNQESRQSDRQPAEYNYYTSGAEKGQASDSGGTAIGGDGSGSDSSDGLVNINTADIDGLCKLPGVGEGRAKAIIEYRQAQGGFKKKEDIMSVSGIGEKMFVRMEKYLTVE